MIHPNIIHRRNAGSRLLAVALACAGLLLAVAASAAPASARQHKDLLSRLVQSDNEAATRAFVQGRALLSEEKWAQAVSTFSRFINDYPSDKNREADGVLQALLGRFPKATWADDAKVLRARVKAKGGVAVAVDENDPNDE